MSGERILDIHEIREEMRLLYRSITLEGAYYYVTELAHHCSTQEHMVLATKCTKAEVTNMIQYLYSPLCRPMERKNHHVKLDAGNGHDWWHKDDFLTLVRDNNEEQHPWEIMAVYRIYPGCYPTVVKWLRER